MSAKKAAKSVSAREMMTQLEDDSQFSARRATRDHAIAAIRARRKIAEEPILVDLRKVGIDVESVWSLVNTAKNYDVAVPALLAHLQRDYDDETRGVVARALSVPSAAFAWPTLVREYKSAKEPVYRPAFGAKHGLAVALGMIATGDRVDELASLALERENGPSRIYFLPKLRRSKRKAAQDALIVLADDPELKTEIASWSRKSRGRK